MHKRRKRSGISHDSVLFILAVGSDGEPRVGTDGAHAHVGQTRRQSRTPIGRPRVVFVRVVGVNFGPGIAQDRLSKRR